MLADLILDILAPVVAAKRYSAVRKALWVMLAVFYCCLSMAGLVLECLLQVAHSIGRRNTFGKSLGSRLVV